MEWSDDHRRAACELAAALLFRLRSMDLRNWWRWFVDSFRQSGSSLFTLGFADTNQVGPTILAFMAAATGPIVIALLIGSFQRFTAPILTAK